MSTIDELPPGRTPVVTKVVHEVRRDEVIARIQAQVAQGRQVYWVCPLIEESEALDLRNATQTHAAGCNQQRGLVLPRGNRCRWGCCISRMGLTDKKAVMAAFCQFGQPGGAGQHHVIEVGWTPNASLMVIEHAERFGLSQLHQLRGRVGAWRGGVRLRPHVFHWDAPRLSEAARERAAMIETHDGFEIARRDLAIRGPGEFLGLASRARPCCVSPTCRGIWNCWTGHARLTMLLDNHPSLAQRHVERWLGGKSEYLKA